MYVIAHTTIVTTMHKDGLILKCTSSLPSLNTFFVYVNNLIIIFLSLKKEKEITVSGVVASYLREIVSPASFSSKHAQPTLIVSPDTFLEFLLRNQHSGASVFLFPLVTIPALPGCTGIGQKNW